MALVPFAGRLPALPAASDHVTALLAVSVSGVPTVVEGSAGVIAGAAPAAAAVPVPARVSVCGDPAALSATVIVPLSAVVADGVNVTAMMHVSPTPRAEPQLLETGKSPAFAPLTAMPEMESDPVPLLESEIA